MSPLFLSAVLFLPASASAAAGAELPEPFLFANLVTTHREGSSNPAAVASCGDAVAFVATDDHYGRELWRTDGTRRGTFLLADLCTGRCSAEVSAVAATPPGEPQFLEVRIGGALHLWRTDCTEAGTFRLGGSAGQFLLGTWVPERKLLVYRGADAGGGSEPWVTDGTVAGTRRLADVNAGAAGSEPQSLWSFGGFVWFTAHDPQHGRELWHTDGTPAGTARVADITPGPGDGVGRVLGPAGNALVFEGIDPAAGLEPWSVTPGGAPRRLADATLGAAGSRLSSWARDGGRLLFHRQFQSETVSFGTEVWVTDGTPVGTRRIITSSTTYALHAVAAAGAQVLFFHDDGVHGRELWTTDGTAAGTRMVTEICPGICSANHDGVLLPFAGAWYFPGSEMHFDSELWRTDGTAAGTFRVADLCPGPCGSSPVGPDANGLVVTGRGSGREALWHTDGTAAGTVELASFDVVWPAALLGTTEAGTLLRADDGLFGSEPWWTDGTAAGTFRLADLFRGGEDGSRPALLTRFGDRFAFVAFDDSGRRRLWVSDGTREGTRTVPETPGLEIANTGHLAAGAGGVFLLTAVRDEHGNHTGRALLHWTDGAAVPRRLAEVPASFGVHTEILAGDEDGLFVYCAELWHSDGTAAGTRQLAAFPPHSFRASGILLDGRFYFVSAFGDPFVEYELAVSDGTPAGTVRLHQDPRWSVGSRPHDLVLDGEGGFWFVGAHGESSDSLWRSDGTPAGTRAVVDFADSPQPHELRVAGGRLFFSGSSGSGSGLWTSDGTPQGTLDLQAPFIIPGSDFGSEVVSFDGELVYHATPFAAPPFWRSDGTEAGSAAIFDLAPSEGGFELFGVPQLWTAGGRLFVFARYLGEPWKLWMRESLDQPSVLLATFPASEFGPTGLVELGSRVFFSIEDEDAGHELWALDLAAAPPPPQDEACVADAETLCLGGGRFRLRAEWRNPRTGRSGTAGALPFTGSQRTGLFWFFNPNNVELIVKMLDGTGVNGFHWTFYGALSDVEFWLDVEDLETGARRTYHNPPTQVCGRADTTTFDARPLPGTGGAVRAAATAGGCGGGPGSDPAALCLLDRFRVEVDWRNQRTGATGIGTAVPGTDRSGYFWFFRDDNVELVVKVLDGRPVNGRFWVFYGALTDVEYTLTVTDTQTGAMATYHNPPGEVCGEADTAAF